MTMALPPDGKGRRSWRCLDCDKPDPFKSDTAHQWLKGELGKRD
jgi:hypothetical protein